MSAIPWSSNFQHECRLEIEAKFKNAYLTCPSGALMGGLSASIERLKSCDSVSFIWQN